MTIEDMDQDAEGAYDLIATFGKDGKLIKVEGIYAWGSIDDADPFPLEEYLSKPSDGNDYKGGMEYAEEIKKQVKERE